MIGSAETLLLIGGAWGSTFAPSRESVHGWLVAQRDRIDWASVLELAALHRVEPLLNWALSGVVGSDENLVPGGARETLDRACSRVAAANADFLIEAGRVAHACSDAGLEIVIRKGLPLAQLLFGDINRRGTGDIDILIRRGAAGDLRALLRELGYEYGNPTPNGIVPWERQTEVALAAGGLNLPGFALPRGRYGAVIEIGVVTALFDRRTKLTVPIDELFRDARAIGIGSASLPCLSDVDFLIDLCAHFVKDATSALAIEWQIDLLLYKFSDVARFAARLTDLDRWGEFIASVTRRGIQRPMYFALCYVEAVFAAAVPEDVLAAIRPDTLAYLHEYGESGRRATWPDTDIKERLFDRGRGARRAVTSKLRRALQ